MESEDVYIDSYRLVAKLGSGAFGDVYLAQHAILTNRIVAIKLMHVTDLDSSQAIFRFFTEAQILEKLMHPNILPIIDVSAYGGIPYIVTEYASKGSLRDRLERQHPRLIPIEESIAILAQIGQALQHAHQHNIIHRDLKPENILFNDKGDALLSDFGIATILTTASLKQTTITGTMSYMAPEQFHEMVSKESDQYALGCIAYELFTGHMPFTASNLASLITKCLMEQPIAPRKYNPQLPVHIEAAVLKAMAKERSDRYPNVSAFIAALRTSDASTPGKTRGTPSSSAETLNEKGILLTQQQHFQEALEALEQALKLNPNYASAWCNKGNVLWELFRLEEALEAYKQALQVNQYYTPAYIGEGKVLLALKRYDEALAAFEEAIQLYPTNTTAWSNKGETLWNLNSHIEALEAY